MSFQLDANILSHHMRGTPGLTHRFIQHSGRLVMPAVVLAELYAGAYMLKDPASLLAQIGNLLSFIDVVDFDASCAEAFGKLRGDLQRRGLVVPPGRLRHIGDLRMTGKAFETLNKAICGKCSMNSGMMLTTSMLHDITRHHFAWRYL